MSGNRGGARVAGEGKKIGRPKGVTKVQGSYSLSIDVKAFLDENGMSACVDRVIRDSKDFKRWKSRQI